MSNVFGFLKGKLLSKGEITIQICLKQISVNMFGCFASNGFIKI